MSDFKTIRSGGGPLDPHRRTRFTEGMVLGADELRQDQVYHLAKHRLHQRALHGYGPVCGLDVWLRGGAEPALVVEPGVALSPRGHTLRVTAAQCANLADWLAAHREEASPPPASPPAELELCVVLGYRERATDPVPLPSGPCRTVDDTGTPSRLADDFELVLRTFPPAQPEEDAVRRFGELLGRVEIIDHPDAETPAAFAARVRALAPLSSPDASPPEERILLHPDDAAEALRAAFRIWSREVRPQLVDDGCGVLPPREDAVLLARLKVPVAVAADGSLTLDGAATLNEVTPPLLLSTRLLQEWLIRVGSAASRSAVHGNLLELEADDHPQYLRTDGTRPLSGDWSAGTHRITDLGEAAQPGDAMPWGQPVGGDLDGTYPDPTIAGLQGRGVGAQSPSVDEVLTWDGALWIPRPLPVVEPRLTRILALSWPHGRRFEPPGDDSGAQLAITNEIFAAVDLGNGRSVPHLVVGFGKETLGDGGLVTIRKGSLDRSSFLVFLERLEGLEYVRSRFLLEPLVPVGIEATEADGRITQATRVADDKAPGVAARIQPSQVEELLQADRKVWIEIKGDFVLDETETRAIDAQHLRGELPRGSRFGTQGGTFESWFDVTPERNL